MRPAKPAIRAPKIALQQEIREKHNNGFVTTKQGVVKPVSEEEATISFGNLISSLFSRQFVVTVAIIAVIFTLVFLVNHIPEWLAASSRPHHTTAVPFELPSEIENQRVPVREAAPFNPTAEAYYIEGNKMMVAGSAHRAEHLFRQAAEANPDEQKYWNAWQAVRREADFDVFKRQMEALLGAGRADEAWEAYVNGVKRDRRFFHRYTPDFAERLVKEGYLASAASILMTYNDLHPVNANAKPLLEKIRNTP